MKKVYKVLFDTKTVYVNAETIEKAIEYAKEEMPNMEVTMAYACERNAIMI